MRSARNGEEKGKPRTEPGGVPPTRCGEESKLTQVVLRRGGHEVRRRKGKHQEAIGSYKEENVVSSV